MARSQQHVEAIADAACRHGLTVAAAESLTSGLISSRLGAGPDAATWFAGGVTAYREETKYDVLGVRPGPLVSTECAEQMVRGVARLLGSSATVAVTGVGGPDPEENEPPGTVYVAVLVGDALEVRRLDLASDDPEEILDQTADRALALLADAVVAHHG